MVLSYDFESSEAGGGDVFKLCTARFTLSLLKRGANVFCFLAVCFLAKYVNVAFGWAWGRDETRVGDV